MPVVVAVQVTVVLVAGGEGTSHAALATGEIDRVPILDINAVMMRTLLLFFPVVLACSDATCH